MKRVLQKPIEWMIAIKLERVYTKEELIKMYLNRFDFLNNAIGIKTAAAVYFNKLPSQLNIHPSPNPSFFHKSDGESQDIGHQEHLKQRIDTNPHIKKRAGTRQLFSSHRAPVFLWVQRLYCYAIERHFRG